MFQNEERRSIHIPANPTNWEMEEREKTAGNSDEDESVDEIQAQREEDQRLRRRHHSGGYGTIDNETTEMEGQFKFGSQTGMSLDDMDGYGEPETPGHPFVKFFKKHYGLIQSLSLFLIFFVAIMLFCSVPDEEESGVHFDFIGVSVTEPFLYSLDSSQPMNKLVIHLWVSVLSHAYPNYNDGDNFALRDGTRSTSFQLNLILNSKFLIDPTVYYLSFDLMGQQPSGTWKNYGTWLETLGALHSKYAVKNRALHDIKVLH